MRNLYGMTTLNTVRLNKHKHSFFRNDRTVWICSLDSETSNELERRNNTCKCVQEHGLSVLLARTDDAVWFACLAFGSLVGCCETIIHPVNFRICTFSRRSYLDITFPCVEHCASAVVTREAKWTDICDHPHSSISQERGTQMQYTLYTAAQWNLLS